MQLALQVSRAIPKYGNALGRFKTNKRAVFVCRFFHSFVNMASSKLPFKSQIFHDLPLLQTAISQNKSDIVIYHKNRYEPTVKGPQNILLSRDLSQ